MTQTTSTTLRLVSRARAAILAAALASAGLVLNAQGQANLAAQAVTPANATAAITLTKPTRPVSGENEFAVTVADPDGKPVDEADVSILLVMPAMPMMSMPEMRRTVTLKPAEEPEAVPGLYVGHGQVPMPGRWTVTITAAVGGKTVGEKKLTLTAK